MRAGWRPALLLLHQDRERALASKDENRNVAKDGSRTRTSRGRTASALPLSYVPIEAETISQAARPSGPTPRMSNTSRGADGGNRTRDPGTADRCVATTLHLQRCPPLPGGEDAGGARSTFRIECKNQGEVSRAGIEPASCGVKDRCKGQRLLPARERQALHRRRAPGENRTRAFSLRGNCTTVVLRGQR